MRKKTVYIEYTKLKEITQQVLAFARTHTDVEQKMNLHTCMDEDLGMASLDLLLFLEDFEQTFQIKLPTYTAQSEIPLPIKIRHVLFVILGILVFPVTLLYFLFRKESTKQKIRRNARRNTLGDLTASVAVGHYVKREEVQIRLKHGSRFSNSQ